ncbi:MAG: GntR family transcriptional regulator [Anaerolineae bacterium]|nr:GntR family transcriptional regulator [Anaerolineae bacterium]
MSMLRANSQIPLYMQLYRQLRSEIEQGALQLGGQLPSERQLAADYGISRLTARKALSMLREEGVISARRGRGSFVS